VAEGQIDQLVLRQEQIGFEALFLNFAVSAHRHILRSSPSPWQGEGWGEGRSSRISDDLRFGEEPPPCPPPRYRGRGMERGSGANRYTVIKPVPGPGREGNRLHWCGAAA